MSNDKSNQVIQALKTGNVSNLRRTLDTFPDFSKNSTPALKEAVNLNRVDLLKVLVEEYNADINFNNGRLLENAVNNGYLEIVKCLLDNGINLTCCSPITLEGARRKGYTEIADLITGKKASAPAKPSVFETSRLGIYREKRAMAEKTFIQNVESTRSQIQQKTKETFITIQQTLEKQAKQMEEEKKTAVFQKKWEPAGIDFHWECRHGYGEHEVFLSHRVKSDKHNARAIYEVLQSHFCIHAFLDCECINNGLDWMYEFLKGLRRSSICVLFISKGCLSDIAKAHQQRDNNLLEWEIALEMQKHNLIHIVPLLVGEKMKNRDENIRFTDFDCSHFPDELHCHPESPKINTVRKTMEEIFKLQGTHVTYNHPESAVRDIVESLLKFEERREKIFGHRKFTPNSGALLKHHAPIHFYPHVSVLAGNLTKVDVFTFHTCISAGRDHDMDHVQSLLSSSIIVIMYSDYDINCEEFRKAHEQPSGRLLEWEYALELQRKFSDRAIPVYIRTPAVSQSNINFNIFPEFAHIHKMSPRRYSIRDVVKKILLIRQVNTVSEDMQSLAFKLLETKKNILNL
ncbi:hypothetical protein HK098_000508 [Nowakowskiella sp. JEL0407]|nr:hypothetical protein HK098_000508 [Nowakowskiella sp. JEL0407]